MCHGAHICMRCCIYRALKFYCCRLFGYVVFYVCITGYPSTRVLALHGLCLHVYGTTCYILGKVTWRKHPGNVSVTLTRECNHYSLIFCVFKSVMLSKYGGKGVNHLKDPVTAYTTYVVRSREGHLQYKGVLLRYLCVSYFTRHISSLCINNNT